MHHPAPTAEGRRVDDRVRQAADNNAQWCDLVCRSHGVPTARERGLWVALRRPPMLYPDAVTLSPDLAAEDVLQSVQDGPGCSVKDSFGTLDLAPMGFDQFFRAQWIYSEPASPSRTVTPAWSVVETDEDFDEWTHAAGLSGILRRELLTDPSVRFLSTPGAGAVVNRTGSVVGVSNVFTTAIAIDEAWAGIAAAVAGVFPQLPLVGYERGDALHAALAAGFAQVGPLRVWLRPA